MVDDSLTVLKQFTHCIVQIKLGSLQLLSVLQLWMPPPTVTTVVMASGSEC